MAGRGGAERGFDPPQSRSVSNVANVHWVDLKFPPPAGLVLHTSPPPRFTAVMPVTYAARRTLREEWRSGEAKLQSAGRGRERTAIQASAYDWR